MLCNGKQLFFCPLNASAILALELLTAPSLDSPLWDTSAQLLRTKWKRTSAVLQRIIYHKDYKAVIFYELIAQIFSITLI